jgi:DNA-binding CsgD family transcriptional regulator
MADARAALDFAAALAGCTREADVKELFPELITLLGAEAMLVSHSGRWAGEGSFELADPEIYYPELLGAVGRAWRDHPFVPADLRAPREQVLRLSDAAGEGWRGGALFSDFYRPLGMGRELSAQLAWSPGASCCIAFHRGGRDFGEREGALLELLAPHLRAARVRAVTPPPRAEPHLGAGELASRLGITPREAEVLVLLAAGRANKEIAGDLGISTNTVVRHVENIYKKLDVHNRAAATRIALCG